MRVSKPSVTIMIRVGSGACQVTTGPHAALRPPWLCGEPRVAIPRREIGAGCGTSGCDDWACFLFEGRSPMPEQSAGRPLTRPEHPSGPRPVGTVAFLFTDIEGSTPLLERYPEAVREILPRHDALLREAIEANSGYVFKTLGDGFCAAFEDPRDAVRAAIH